MEMAHFLTSQLGHRKINSEIDSFKIEDFIALFHFKRLSIVAVDVEVIICLDPLH